MQHAYSGSSRHEPGRALVFGSGKRLVACPVASLGSAFIHPRYDAPARTCSSSRRQLRCLSFNLAACCAYAFSPSSHFCSVSPYGVRTTAGPCCVSGSLHSRATMPQWLRSEAFSETRQQCGSGWTDEGVLEMKVVAGTLRFWINKTAQSCRRLQQRMMRTKLQLTLPSCSRRRRASYRTGSR